MLAPADRKDEIPEILKRISRGERVDHYQTKRRTRDGRIIDISLTVSPIRDDSGTIVGASKIARDITAQVRSEQIAREAAQQRLLLEQVLAAQEDERRRIARELHDEVGQLLTSLLVGLKRLESTTNLSASKAIGRQLREIAGLAMDESRRLAHGLHPAALADHGLHAAVSAYVEEYSKRHNIRVCLTEDGLDSAKLPDAVQIAVYRIIQEALTNVARHAHAKKVDVTLKHSIDSLELFVIDDGAGFDIAALNEFSHNHMGLRSIRERSALLGGLARVTSGDKGTQVLVHVPLVIK